jgi:hypothetical protein
MKRVQPDDPRLEDLRIADFVDYLKDHDWKLVPHPNEGVFLFDGPLDDEGKPFKLLLPRHTGFRDAPLRLSEAVNLVADLEERPIEQVLLALHRRSKSEKNRWRLETLLSPLAIIGAITCVAIAVLDVLQLVPAISVTNISLLVVAANFLLLAWLAKHLLGREGEAGNGYQFQIKMKKESKASNEP